MLTPATRSRSATSRGLGVARDAARAADFERRATKLRATSNVKSQ